MATQPTSDAARVAQDKVLEEQEPGRLPLTGLVPGQAYWFRTLGEIAQGRVAGETPLGGVILQDASWVADTGPRWHLYVADCTSATEVEYEGQAIMAWQHVLRCGPLGGELHTASI